MSLYVAAHYIILMLTWFINIIKLYFAWYLSQFGLKQQVRQNYHCYEPLDVKNIFSNIDVFFMQITLDHFLNLISLKTFRSWDPCHNSAVTNPMERYGTPICFMGPMASSTQDIRRTFNRWCSNFINLIHTPNRDSWWPAQIFLRIQILSLKF